MAISRAAVGAVCVLAFVACHASTRNASTPAPLEPQAPNADVALAALELPAIFGDGMVLQRGPSTPIWGRAQPGERIRVRLLSADGAALRDARAVAGERGDWRVELAELAELDAGGPYRLEVRGDGRAERVLTVGDVLVGEVWLGSGQSNMRMMARACDGFAEARARANRPSLRVFLEETEATANPQWRGAGRWVRCAPETCGEFSGALLWFGMELDEALHVPIGLIDASVGGSRIELWTSAAPQFASPQIARYVTERDAEYWAFDQDRFLAEYPRRLAEWQALADAAASRGEKAPDPPRNLAEGRLRHGTIGYLSNAKIAPLAGYGLRGFLWYQGEANVHDPSFYGAQLELLVADWRARWGRGNLPFCWVQLPNYFEGDDDDGWSRTREAMRRSLCTPNTGMVVAIDVGQSNDIHPPNKRAIGRRLAGWALDEVYGIPRAWSSPLFAGFVVEGPRVKVSFAPTYGALSPLNRELGGFELAGRDGEWHRARARVARLNTACVIVESDEVPEPVDVRYAWRDDPVVELLNGANLPASPFTTRIE